MCQALSAIEVALSTNPAETTNFRKLLLSRCQRLFEKNSPALVNIQDLKKEIGECNDVRVYFGLVLCHGGIYNFDLFSLIF